MEFERAFSDAPWESEIGYCRAIRAGNSIFVTGTAPVDDEGKPVTPDDGCAQTRRCILLIEKALNSLGADLACVVRTRMLVTDISRWREYGKAHGEFFGEHPPATSMIEVKSLIVPGMLVEMEAEALCGPA